MNALLIVFTDNSRKIISDVDGWYFDTESGNFCFVKNGHRAFLPKENIKYFGREFDYDM